MKKLIKIFLIILTTGLLTGFISNYFEITKNLEIFNNIYRELETSYVEPINPGEFMQKTIDNMLSTLDRWTEYIPESDIEEYRERTITGDYGGIGSRIRKIDDFVVIAEPFKNSPADKSGLKIGDKIIEIDGEKMMGVNTQDVSELLRGTAGKTVALKAETPEGYIKSVNITRETIHNSTVPYYELFDNNIGYVKLEAFKRKSSQEVQTALIELDSLANNQLAGLILDLRFNGGGLLGECLKIVNFFVHKNDTILTSRGRDSGWDKTYTTKKSPLYSNLPIIVLINENSASASEIVAGCLQDLDRGVIIGRTSFGKGLIQKNTKLAYNTQLKLTVAKYYTPSGRCIQNRYFDKNGSRKHLDDSLRSVFFTKNGRTVYGDGGINPDIEIPKKDNLEIIQALIKNNCIFNFGNTIYQNINFPMSVQEFKMSDDIYLQFQEYIEKEEFPFSVYSEEIISLLEESLDEELYLENMKDDIKLLKSKILNNKKDDMVRHEIEIRKHITNDLILRSFYRTGVIEYNLNSDPYISKGIEVLNNHSMYTDILSSK